MLKIEQKARADSVAGWTQSLTSIASVFHSQFAGLLHGTTSWAQAATNIFENFADQAVQAIEKMAIEWIAGQLGMKAAGTATSASAITSDAAVSFAGTAAFLSPIMGPAALGPAAGVQASVLAQLASLNVGTWGLPGDMPIMAHAGEAVIPAFESGKFRAAMDALSSGGGGSQGGGDTHNWHINAIDGASVAAFFKTHGDALAKTVSGRFNAQRSLRPSY